MLDVHLLGKVSQCSVRFCSARLDKPWRRNGGSQMFLFFTVTWMQLSFVVLCEAGWVKVVPKPHVGMRRDLCVPGHSCAFMVCKRARGRLHVGLDMRVHRKLLHRENDPICEAELKALCRNEQYFFRFGCTDLINGSTCGQDTCNCEPSKVTHKSLCTFKKLVLGL